MKTVATTLVLSLLVSVSAIAQTTVPSPSNGAVELGRFEMEFDVISAPQPTLAYSNEPSGTSTEVVVWLTSENKTVLTATTNGLQEWKENDPIYKDASWEYTIEQLGANSYWTSNENGMSQDDQATVIFLNEAGDYSSENDYYLEHNGSNTEVYLSGSN